MDALFENSRKVGPPHLSQDGLGPVSHVGRPRWLEFSRKRKSTLPADQ